ncbi:MAG: M1 family peptidase [Gammaproteobacteria bacterium]|nr:M1 family peptidase [Gammaproteobacteria bacterium]
MVILLVLAVPGASGANRLHHQLQVTLIPAQSHISVVDDIQFPANTRTAEFSLGSSLTLETPGIEHEILGVSSDGRSRHYRINRLPAQGKVQLVYQGNISTQGTRGPFDMPDALLGPEGVFLDGSSRWIPRFIDYPWYTFNLNVNQPSGWELISQGKRSRHGEHVSFDMTKPQDDIYLLGGPYRRYARTHQGVEIVVYLFDEDADLAGTYLDASADYISLYSNWIGPYPYEKFAVVENRWQTGYGMPSFTLLGSRVIRLPFILHTSLPHEIVHNWWGNAVYIDYSSGNWSEGLTAYMSDHFSDEQQGRGSEYRRKALERYANYAAEQHDFALADFSSRHDDASQAVGYSKSMMLFHMIRKSAGDERFNRGIRQLWQRYQFEPVNFPTVIRQLHPGDDEEHRVFIEQWLLQAGAPELALEQVELTKNAEGYLLTIAISQRQPGPAYDLQVPVELALEHAGQARRIIISLTEKHATFKLPLKQRPLSVSLDPDYDVFRLLHPLERPSSLGRLFGSGRQVLVLPASAGSEQEEAWQQLATAWAKRYENIETVKDTDIDELPADASVWLLGWENRLLDRYRERFTAPGQLIGNNSVSLGGSQYRATDHAVVVLDADNSRKPLGFIGAADPAEIVLMGRKLPHYSSYGVLAFTRPGADNILKRHLQVQFSPMMRELPD